MTIQISSPQSSRCFKCTTSEIAQRVHDPGGLLLQTQGEPNRAGWLPRHSLGGCPDQLTKILLPHFEQQGHCRWCVGRSAGNTQRRAERRVDFRSLRNSRVPIRTFGNPPNSPTTLFRTPSLLILRRPATEKPSPEQEAGSSNLSVAHDATSSTTALSTDFLGTLGNNRLSRRFTASRWAITRACVYASKVVASLKCPSWVG